MRINIYKDQMQEAELFGKPVLYTGFTIPREEVPEGWHCYDLCGTDRRPGEPVKLMDEAPWDNAGTALRIQNELNLSFNRADVNPDYMKSLIFAIAAERYWFKRRTRQMFRVKGVSWWPEELPSDEEYEEAVRNLERAGWQVDFVLTHCAPTSIQKKLDRNYTLDRLTDFLQMVKRRCQFDYWFLGHYHRNCVVDDRFIIQWEQITKVK